MWWKIIRLMAIVPYLTLSGASLIAQETNAVRVYFGTYTTGEGRGIYRSDLDLTTGTLAPPVLAVETKNPSFLAIAPNRKFLYSVSEISNFNGQKVGGVAAFAIQPNGDLKLINQQPSGGVGPCHLVVDATGSAVLVANYGGGSCASLPIAADGSLEPAASVIQHQGSSVHPSRQKAPHAHSINLDPSNKFAFVADLGLDQVLVYAFDADKQTLTPHDPPFVKIADGSGPRHFAIHPSGKFAYVINELANTITLLGYQIESGQLKALQTITTLPPNYNETSYTAEVVVHPSGKFLYGSNRGHDSLAVYRIEPDTGLLTAIEQVSTGGQTPRNFAIDPTGQFCLAENQASNTVVVFRINPETGALTQIGTPVAVPSPVCAKFWTPAAE